MEKGTCDAALLGVFRNLREAFEAEGGDDDGEANEEDEGKGDAKAHGGGDVADAGGHHKEAEEADGGDFGDGNAWGKVFARTRKAATEGHNRTRATTN